MREVSEAGGVVAAGGVGFAVTDDFDGRDARAVGLLMGRSWVEGETGAMGYLA